VQLEFRCNRGGGFNLIRIINQLNCAAFFYTKDKVKVSLVLERDNLTEIGTVEGVISIKRCVKP